MNKTEFIDAVSSRSDLPKASVTKALEAMVDVVGDTLRGGDQVTIVGFGTFLVRRREAREGRNPRTGESMHIAASNVPAFKAGKALKDAVN